MRVEDLDTARCKTEYIESLFRDFEWLGLTWEGEVVYQSRRNDLYKEAFNCLVQQDLVYPCYCSRADLHAASAPHSGEEVIYPGTCRNLTEKERISKGRFKDPSFRIMRLLIALKITFKALIVDLFQKNLGTSLFVEVTAFLPISLLLCVMMKRWGLRQL